MTNTNKEIRIQVDEKTHKLIKERAKKKGLTIKQYLLQGVNLLGEK